MGPLTYIRGRMRGLHTGRKAGSPIAEAEGMESNSGCHGKARLPCGVRCPTLFQLCPAITLSI
uniref:Uncharacterized protein n=1 Tax=Prolemur simus TaxID=1328070 RepID=A0A8C8ZYS9_PROSS